MFNLSVLSVFKNGWKDSKMNDTDIMVIITEMLQKYFGNNKN